MEKLMFIVDDNDSNLTVLAGIFENDFKVLTMPSATKMFKLLERKIPDILLIDVEMPDINGFEAIEMLKAKEEWKNIPTIVVTGWVTEDLKNKANDLGAFEVISKPFNIQSIKDCVFDCLAKV